RALLTASWSVALLPSARGGRRFTALLLLPDNPPAPERARPRAPVAATAVLGLRSPAGSHLARPGRPPRGVLGDLRSVRAAARTSEGSGAFFRRTGLVTLELCISSSESERCHEH